VYISGSPQRGHASAGAAGCGSVVNWKNFVLIEPRGGAALVVFTNSSHGMNIAQRFVAASTGDDHVAFQWL
jgi:hypothetical protein